MWKYADDILQYLRLLLRLTTAALQLIVDKTVGWSDRNKLYLRPTKCKELRIILS